MPRIGVVLGSTRPNRLSATVAASVVEQLSAYGEIDLIDLAEVGLPFYDEPKPAAAGEPVHEHTKAWGRRVEPLDAVVIVTPEYNAGYPAVLKNAIDHLYGEWRDKPAAIVTYGGHGGTRCAEQLKQVAAAVGLKVAPTMPALEVPDPVIREGAALHPAEDFRAAIPQIQSAFQELQGLISDAAAAQASTAAH